MEIKSILHVETVVSADGDKSVLVKFLGINIFRSDLFIGKEK